MLAAAISGQARVARLKDGNLNLAKTLYTDILKAKPTRDRKTAAFLGLGITYLEDDIFDKARSCPESDQRSKAPNDTWRRAEAFVRSAGSIYTPIS